MVSSSYTVPTRNASVLGYGGRRPDGQLLERRRLASSILGTPELKFEASAIPYGTGVGLDDRQKMILCFLPPKERHQRASQVFNSRGEWYRSHKYMTLMQDDFLDMCSMPRIAVPRHLGDRPRSRNVAQIQLEQAEVAKNGSSVLNSGFNYHDWRSTLRAQRATQPETARAPPTRCYGPIVNLNATLMPLYIEDEVFKYLWEEAKYKPCSLPVIVNVDTMAFHDLCQMLTQTFFHNRDPGVPEIFIDTIVTHRTDPLTGNREVREIFEHNWDDEIASYLTQHPANELEIGFGIGLLEEFPEEEIQEFPIDPRLF